MAVSFAYRIHALTGFDADSGSASETGQYYRDMTAQWMSESIKEVVNILPPQILQRCAKVSGTNGTANYTNGTGVAHEEKVISAIRTRNTESTPQFDNADDVFVCREIPFVLSHKASDPDSLEYATETDPVFYYEPQVDGTAVKVKVLPKSSAAVTKAYSVDYPVFTASDSGTYDVVNATSIANFPEEIENLVVLKAAILAAEYQLAIEEDTEIFLPIIANLKQEYQQGVLALKTGNVIPPQQRQGAR